MMISSSPNSNVDIHPSSLLMPYVCSCRSIKIGTRPSITTTSCVLCVPFQHHHHYHHPTSSQSSIIIYIESGGLQSCFSEVNHHRAGSLHKWYWASFLSCDCGRRTMDPPDNKNPNTLSLQQGASIAINSIYLLILLCPKTSAVVPACTTKPACVDVFVSSFFPALSFLFLLRIRQGGIFKPDQKLNSEPTAV